MTRFALARLVRAMVVLWGVSTAVFFLLRLSGDPAALLVPANTPPDEIARLRHEWGFDAALTDQYADFLRHLLAGDFGRSLFFGQPAADVVASRVGASLELALVAIAGAAAVGVPVGLVAALHRGGRSDRVLMGVALTLHGTPSFVLGIFFILVLSVYLHLLPTGGRGDWQQLVMPATTVALLLAPSLARITRAEMLQSLQQDYVRTARSKGLAPRYVVTEHALRNAGLPILTMIGLQLGNVLGGSVVVETVFAWPGLGLLAVQSINNRDFPVVQMVVLVVATWFVLTNTVVDIGYAWLDPRTRAK